MDRFSAALVGVVGVVGVVGGELVLVPTAAATLTGGFTTRDEPATTAGVDMADGVGSSDALLDSTGESVSAPSAPATVGTEIAKGSVPPACCESPCHLASVGTGDGATTAPLCSVSARYDRTTRVTAIVPRMATPDRRALRHIPPLILLILNSVGVSLFCDVDDAVDAIAGAPPEPEPGSDVTPDEMRTEVTSDKGTTGVPRVGSIRLAIAYSPLDHCKSISSTTTLVNGWLLEQ